MERAQRAACNADYCNCLVAGDNRSARLGAILGELAKAGRDKVTLVTSPAIASFGDWVEQLIAESTGKAGKGILPVVGEPLGAPAVYGDDRLFVHLRLPGAVAVATSVFVVAVTVLSAAGGHLARFLETGGETLDTVLSLVIFTVPGVIIGAQLGSWVARRIPQHTLERMLGILFVLIALLTLGEVVL